MKKLPLVTIVGVPNTGKSTLFNRLSGEKKALVHSEPGMTRDLFKARCLLSERAFFLQDSGGYFPDKRAISAAINSRIVEAASASDLVIFLFDGRRELLGYEKDLYLEVQKINRNIIAVLNKVDNPENYICPVSYYDLKLDFITISATHNLNLEKLEEAILEVIGDGRQLRAPAGPSQTIAVFGKPNVGKSTLVNALIGRETMIVSPEPGTTRDSVEIEFTRNQSNLMLVDNAGVRKKSKVAEDTELAGIVRAEKNLRKADLILFVVDISRPLDQNDMLIAAEVRKAAKPLIIVLNKCDLLADPQLNDKRVKALRQRLHSLYFAAFQPVSALQGKNVNRILEKAEEIRTLLHETKIKTAVLNKIGRKLLAEKRYLTMSGRPLRVKYFSIESYQPLFIKFHSRQEDRLRATDELHLKKRFLAEIGWEGIPVFFKTTPSD